MIARSTLALLIPAYNAAAYLPRLLEFGEASDRAVRRDLGL